jgi:hypothetical protein
MEDVCELFRVEPIYYQMSNQPKAFLHTNDALAPRAMHCHVPQPTARPPRNMRKLLQRTHDIVHNSPFPRDVMGY